MLYGALFWLWRESFITTGKKKDTVVCLAGARSLLQPGKKRYSRLSGGCVIIITTRKKKIQSSVWRVRIHYYNRKKKKIQLSVWRVRDRYYDRKKKKIQSSVWRMRDDYYDRKKKDTVVSLAGAQSCLSGGCAIIITTGKKKF